MKPGLGRYLIFSRFLTQQVLPDALMARLWTVTADTGWQVLAAGSFTGSQLTACWTG